MQNSNVRHLFLTTAICFVLLACQISILPATSSIPFSATSSPVRPPAQVSLPTPTPAPILALIPLDAQKKTPSEYGPGFADYILHVAIQNKGTALYVGGWPSEGTVKVKEGFEYSATVGYDDPVIGWSPYPLISGGAPSWLLPPGFAVTGEAISKLSIHTAIGEKTTPSTLYLDGFPELNLEDPFTKPLFPTGRPDSDFLSVPNTFEIPTVGLITVQSFRITVDRNIPTFWMRYEYKNLSIGKEQQTPKMLLTTVNNEGLITNWTQFYLYNGVCPYGGSFYGVWTVGPDQTITRDLCWSLFGPNDQGQKASSKGMKVIMYLQDYNITKIYNTGF